MALICAPLAVPAAADPPSRVVLPSAAPSWLTGTPEPTDPQRVLPLRVYLSGRNPSGRVRAARAVSSPGNARYGHYLSPAQFRRQYGSDRAQLDRVSAWLSSEGMTITATNPHFITVNATVAQVDAAFDIQESRISDNVAPVGDITVPGALGSDITTVTGLFAGAFAVPADARTSAHQAPARPAAGANPTSAMSAPAPSPEDYPCSQWWGQHTATIPEAYGHTSAPTRVCGYTPTQLRQAYGVAKRPYTGKGATVAVVLDGHAPTMEADANRFFADQGVPGFAAGQYSENFAPTFADSCGDNADQPEEALDVETVHIAAPDAKVVYVGADCDYDSFGQLSFLDAQTRVVDQHLADVTTDSWSNREDSYSPATVAAWELTFQQGTIEGIGFNFDAGDYSSSPDDAFVQYPASDPWATGVGGTSLEIGAKGTAVGEYGWGDNDDSIGADGYSEQLPGEYEEGTAGGRSNLFAEPGYQRGVVASALATADGTGPARRVVPDVSANSGVFWRIGFTGAVTDGVYGELPEGGTSGSSPLLAGLEADAKQASRHALGFVNPALYALNGTRAPYDVRPVSPADPPIMVGPDEGFGDGPYLTTMGEDNTLSVTPGFDAVTGLGTPTTSFVTAFTHPVPVRLRGPAQ